MLTYLFITYYYAAYNVSYSLLVRAVFCKVAKLCPT